jgi:hypothetical protein
METGHSRTGLPRLQASACCTHRGQQRVEARVRCQACEHVFTRAHLGQHVEQRAVHAELGDHAGRLKADAHEEHNVGVPQRGHHLRLLLKLLQGLWGRAAGAVVGQQVQW